MSCRVVCEMCSDINVTVAGSDSAAHTARLIPDNTLAVTDRHKEDQQQ